MRSLTKPLLFAGLMITAGVAGYFTQQLSSSPDTHSSKNSHSVVGSYRPEFTLPDHDGLVHKLSEWDDHVIVVNFWATWCPPCRDEIPEFIDLQDVYSEQGLQFIGIALETPDKVKPYAEEIGINYPSLVGEAEVIQIANQYGNVIGGLPYTVLIDRDGIIQYLHQGAISRQVLLDEIKKFL